MSIPRLEVHRHSDHTLVRVLGCSALSESNLAPVASQLAPLAADAARPRLLLDLGDIQSLTSVVLGQFVSLHRRLKASGGELVLCNVCPEVATILEVTRLDTLFSIHTDPPRA